MKQLIFFVCLLTTVETGNAQNWAPITSNENFYYQSNEANFISHSIFVDSVTYEGVDSVFHFNRIVKRCDSCTLNLIDDFEIGFLGYGYKVDHESFFGLQVQIENDSIWTFIGNQTWVIHPHKSMGELWDWNADGVEAQVSNLSEEMVFGEMDSVKTINLSSGQTLKLSKSFGIILMPSFESEEGSPEHYELKGIKERSLGDDLPGFDDYFDFEVGDIFQYSKSARYDYSSYGSSESESCYGTIKLRVLDLEYSEEGLFVQYERTQRDTCTNMIWQIETVSWSQDTVYLLYSYDYYDDLNHQPNGMNKKGSFSPPLDHNDFFDGPSIEPASSSLITQYTKAEDNRVIEYFGGYSFMDEHIETAVLLDPYVTPQYQSVAYEDSSFFFFGNEWHISELMNGFGFSSHHVEEFALAEGLGVVCQSFNSGEFQVDSWNKSSAYWGRGVCLNAFETDEGIYGEIIPDEILLAVEDNNEVKAEVFLYPNPAWEYVVVESDKLLDQVKILDLTGQVVFELVVNSEKVRIDLSEFVGGVYLLQCGDQVLSLIVE